MDGRRFACYRWGVTPDFDSRDGGEAVGAARENTKLDCEAGVCVRETCRGASSAGIFDSASGKISGSKGGTK